MPFVSAIKAVVLKPITFFRSLSLKKRLFVIIVFLILSVITLSTIFGSQKPAYITAIASKSTITETVSEAGSISINGRTDINSPATGVVENVFVTNGDPVIIGQELFTIKSSATEQEKSQALATHLAAQNARDTANTALHSLQSSMFSEWDTFRKLAESSSYDSPEERNLPAYHIAEKDWLASENNYKKQQAVISQAQASVASTYLLYQATQNATVKATADGTIANISVTTGTTVKAYTAVAPPTPLATISNPTTTEILVSFSENDIAKIKVGQTATIDVSAVHDKKYKGVVRRVDTIGTNNQGVIRYNAYIEVLNPDEQLRPGMNVDVVITTNTVTHVLSVPNAAVKPYQGGRAVRITNDKGELTYIPVIIGIRGTTKTQIIKGITEGQFVITSLSNDQIKRAGPFGN